MRARCPKCRNTLNVADGLVGKKAKCPACGLVFRTTAGASGSEPQEDPKGARGMARKGGEKGGAKAEGPGVVERFVAKLGELVGKVIPDKWLPVAFSGSALLALVFLVFMIVGYSRSPGDVASAAIEGLQSDLAEAVDARDDLERRARTAERELEPAKARLEATQKSEERLKTRVDELAKELREERTKLRSAEREAKTGAAEAVRERDAARKEAAGLAKRVEALETQLANLRTEHVELQRTKDERQKAEERARQAFESIMETAAKIDDPERKIEVIERMRASSADDLAGTAYASRLESAIGMERQRLVRTEREAEQKAVREAKEAYGDAMRKLATARTHEEQMAVLSSAKRELAGTDYEVRIDREIRTREAAHAEKLARQVYEEVIARVQKDPTAYEENLAALREALPKTEGTRYEPALRNLVEARERTLKEDIGRAAYRAARSRIAASPRDHQANIDALAEEKAKATGTRWEQAIEKLIARERKLLERAK
jgi:hypothetical protein